MRVAPAFAVKEIVTTPLVTPTMFNQDVSLLAGANGGSKLTVTGSTAGKESVPAALFSKCVAVFTNARGKSWAAPLKTPSTI